MKNEFEATLTLNHPLTEEDMDIITDVDFDHTDRVWFYTKHGKEVEFVKVTRCKDCKHFTLNLVENVDGVPLIVAHEVCSFWGDGCKTSQEGFCHFGERKEE